MLNYRYVLFGIIFIGGGVCGALIGDMAHPFFCTNYLFINRDLACGAGPAIAKGEYLSLENDIRATIKSEVDTHKVAFGSVYFRDLRNGPTFGVNQSQPFAPASLFKLPLVFALMSMGEDDSSILKQTFVYAPSSVGGIPIPAGIEITPDALVPGKEYTVEQLAQATLAHSDNLAFYILVNYLNNMVPNGTQNILRIYQELGIIDPRTPTEEVVTVRGYASLFRLLYNASYLNPQHSEQVLTWMAGGDFNEGLRAGAPKGITVADKWGVRSLGDGTEQFHDCGIIYFPRNPYLLCVMTSGADEKELTSLIATISREVYQEVNSRRL